MNVDVLAYTTTPEYPVPMRDAYGYEMWDWKNGHDSETDADVLAEAAGRLCYKSFNRPNPKTARNEDYLKNIIDQGHFSVLEHSSVTFLVRGVSRALLTELTRHRHLSFSVVSQRYVDYSETEPVIPPALEGTPAADDIRTEYRLETDFYGGLVTYLMEDLGKSRKEAREAARAVLPNAAPVDMVVTGNLRAWRDVLGKRWHKAADVEICRFAGLVLGHLRDIAPNSVQDIPDEPYGS
ncbi:ThyX-like thymidylate synthase [Streptomyces phage Ibantik]|uniref:ThyX-like thymidylate synthase n=1 Tax=Streptomyces phage Ibantik TaxID=2182397 RepID=A0A2U8UP98_9CAUD|nr:ThyX-like thymidylate synthase [Streptomyces phage Ibantik]AWN05246.1 ThyX-like thymidylate synthase [Streptomyces phage Ibantik]